MPNHVTTRCTVTGAAGEVDRFRKRMITTTTPDKGEPHTLLNFEQIIPMPASASEVVENGLAADVIALLCGSSGMVEIWRRLQGFDRENQLGPWKGLFAFEKGEIEERLEKAFPGCVKNARAMALCFGETGYKSWYDWSIRYWGTKWNSYSFRPVSEEPLEFLFDTAWSFPTPVFEAIAKEFPSLAFKCLTLCEGYNFGGVGYFNPPPGESTYLACEASDALYELVHGEPPPRDDDEGAESEASGDHAETTPSTPVA